jgi:hypothetical protein
MALDAWIKTKDFLRAGGSELFEEHVRGQVQHDPQSRIVIGFTRATVGFGHSPAFDPAHEPLEFKFKRGSLESAKIVFDRLLREVQMGYPFSAADLRDLHLMIDHTP